MKREQTLEVAVPPEAALAACRRAFNELGWEILEAEEARLVAMEVPFRLDCLTGPSSVEVVARSASPERTTLTVAGSARGIRPRRLDAQMEVLERRILARVS